MADRAFSYSRLSKLDCQVRYCLSYIDRLGQGPQGIEAFVGTVVHGVVEDDHLGKMDRSSPTAPWEALRAAWAEKWTPDLIDVRNKGQQHWLDRAMRCMSNYERMGRLGQNRLIGIEHDLSMPLFDGARFRGIIDRAVETADGPEVHDFKTGRRATKDRLLADHQLPLYAELLVHSLGLDPGVTIPCARYYLFDGKIDPVIATPARRAEAIEWARTRAVEATQLEEKYRAARAAGNDPEVEANVTPLCGWCGYKRRGCPAHQSAASVMI